MAQTIPRLDIQKILIVNLAGMGDLVMSSAAVRSLREKFPNTYIPILVLSENEDLFKNCPYINGTFVLKTGWGLDAIIDNLITIFRLRKHKFDIAINLYNLYTTPGALKIWFMFLLMAPKKILGRDTDGKGFFYTMKIADSMKSQRHQVKRMLDVVKFLGAPDTNKTPEVWSSQAANERVKEFLRENNIADSDIVIGVNPGSRRAARRWPSENFAKMSDELMLVKNVKVVLTGSTKEKGLSESIIDSMSATPINACGQFSIDGLIAFLQRCNLFICNDTGPAHIANALKRPLIVLAGSGSPVTYPFQEENCKIIKKLVDCSPCNKSKCDDLECLRSITPQEVAETARGYIV